MTKLSTGVEWKEATRLVRRLCQLERAMNDALWRGTSLPLCKVVQGLVRFIDSLQIMQKRPLDVLSVTKHSAFGIPRCRRVNQNNMKNDTYPAHATPSRSNNAIICSFYYSQNYIHNIAIYIYS